MKSRNRSQVTVCLSTEYAIELETILRIVISTIFPDAPFRNVVTEKRKPSQNMSHIRIAQNCREIQLIKFTVNVNSHIQQHRQELICNRLAQYVVQISSVCVDNRQL
jgi:GH15 family glucan-1,4-alpha-glucosidase